MDPSQPPRRRQTADNPQQPNPEDLPPNEPPQTPPSGETRQPGRIRALTDSLRGRTRDSWTSGGSYSPLSSAEEFTPTRPRDAPRSIPAPAGMLLTIPNDGGNRGMPSTPTSPTDGVGLQAALAGIPGLDFGMDPSISINDPHSIDPTSSHLIASALPGSSAQQTHMRYPSIPSSINTVRTQDSVQNEEGPYPGFSTIPLSDAGTPIIQNAAPISGAAAMESDGQRHDRIGKRRSVHFGPVHFDNPPTVTVSTSMLGDELNQAEEGTSPGMRPRRQSSARSLSPKSPLLKTGTAILRNMSQRIVNLSNEQDVVEKAIRRKASQSQKEPPEGIEMDQVPPIPGTLDGPDTAAEIDPFEKAPAVEETPVHVRRKSQPKCGPNPFLGKSLGLFSPENWLRMKLCDLLLHPWTEPTVFCLIILQTILLAIDSSRTVQYNDPKKVRFGKSWIDYFLLVLFVIYTIELFIRIIVSGFILNPREHSTINREIGWRRALQERMRTLFGTPHTTRPRAATLELPNEAGPQQPSLLRAFTMQGGDEVARGDSGYKQRARLAQRAFLRHSFNRVDFVAVIAYWISLALSIFAFETGRHIFVFRMLSCLRIMRLLYLTSGTTVIVRSLKKAAPLLLNVAFLIGFFWLLLAIIGVQSFKSSFRRQCVWTNPNNPNDTWINNFQFCGGHIDPVSSQPMPWVKMDMSIGTTQHKGYLCPAYSICQEVGNPYNGSVSFDNIAQSLELIFVIMSSNTFTDLMYYLTNSDYLAAAIFFAVAIVIMFLWLVNLLIAVITSSFQVIREEGKASAFTGEDEAQKLLESEEEATKKPSRTSNIKKAFDHTNWLWIGIITAGLVVQSMRSADMGPRRASFVSITETVVTLLLALEIIIRIAVDRKNFFRGKRNLVDLGTVIITCIIQLPPIHNSGQPYAWLTFFQIIRIYRVVLAVPITRDLVLVVLGNVTGLANLILFVFLFTFLAAILAAQMFRGTIPQTDPNTGNTIRVQFTSIWNSFLGMYQIFSSENWTTILYTVTNFEIYYNTAWMAAAFFIMWYILSNFIVLNMFIAVIQENFDVSEDEKRLQQVKAFLEQKDAGVGSANGNLSLSTIFRYGLVSGRRQDPMAFGSSAAAEMLLKDAVVKDFLDQNDDICGLQSPGYDMDEPRPLLRPAPTAVVRSGTMSSIWTSFVGKIRNAEPNPFYSRLDFNRAGEEVDPTQLAKDVMNANQRRKRAQREYLHKHPRYNVSLFIFKPDSKLRRICQRIVGPGRGGDRIEGVAPSIPVWYAFSAFIYAAVVAMVILACVTTPLYQKEYFAIHKFSPKNWFVFSDMGFAVLFAIEAAIKVVADGFFWTPNAYFRSSWGFIDGVVLITLWINVASALTNAGQVSRAVGAFKALRALRLLNVSDSARENFHAVVVRGGIKVVSAAFVSLSLLIPFAIYGLNLFSNRMQSCNDTNSNISDLNTCVGEYNSSNPFNWNVYSPRVVANDYYSFDDFGSALFILFQIVSQEGWTDVMWKAQSLTGVFQQPQPFASQGNAIFFVIFNLLGAVFVLTLFVSVFMRNYTEMTGVAFLTSDQRSWLELRKLLRQISPSKRPSNRDRQKEWRKLVYRLAVTKTGYWQRFVTVVLVLHLILLCLDFYPAIPTWELIRGMICSPRHVCV
jgi:hypothetical protein